MEILKPDLMWVEGRCYRINLEEFSQKGEEDRDVFEDEPLECPVEESYDDYEIESLENGSYRISLQIPKTYFANIIGTKGNVLHRLQEETKTQIRVPKLGQEGNIVVTGTNRNGVSAASRRINLIVISARQKQAFTHFLSIPVTGNTIKKNFVEFKEMVLETCSSSRGIDASIFQSPHKLHLTLGTLVLMDKIEREKAAERLKLCKEEIIDPMFVNRILMINMSGIEYMNDDPAEVDVLYGKVQVIDGSDILQNLADEVVNYFNSLGLMQKQYEKVKLHVTLMNTLFRNESEQDKEVPKRKRETFNAVNILKNYDDFNFGDQLINSIHLSLRYSTSSTGYYQATSEISF